LAPSTRTKRIAHILYDFLPFPGPWALALQTAFLSWSGSRCVKKQSMRGEGLLRAFQCQSGNRGYARNVSNVNGMAMCFRSSPRSPRVDLDDIGALNTITRGGNLRISSQWLNYSSRQRGYVRPKIKCCMAARDAQRQESTVRSGNHYRLPELPLNVATLTDSRISVRCLIAIGAHRLGQEC
jgi:hypothetical protein